MENLKENFDKLEASKPNKRLEPQEINLHFTHKYPLLPEPFSPVSPDSSWTS